MKNASTHDPALSVVIPCYNEEHGIAPLLARLLPVCQASFGHSFEVILIDDGSKDHTWQEIVSNADLVPNIVGLKLSRNYGHQKALSAGLNQVRGDYIFVLDADLQDPPELLSRMLEMVQQGNDVVYGQRRERAGETWFKRESASWFYRVLSKLSDVEIPKDTGDFRLMTRRVVDQLNAMPESHRFIRGMVSWIGFKQGALHYDRDERLVGETHYPLKKMISFAIDAVTSFSIIPLRIASWFGAFISAVSCLGMIGVAISYLFGNTIAGWSSLAVLILFIGGTQLLVLGIIGEYVGRIYSDNKRRPLYIIDGIYSSAEHNKLNPVGEMHELIRKAQHG
jgi:glycosyltransferase involved in cell wall biosynthesis